MTVPDEATLQTLIDEAAGLGMMSGVDNNIRLAAYEISWDMAEYAVGTNLLATGTDCEFHARPTGWISATEPLGLIMLNRTDLVAVDTVTITHDQFECDCDDEDVSGCAHVYHDTYGIIRVEYCGGPADCACGIAGRPVKVEVCYTSGKWGTIGEFPQTVKTALALMAKFWSDVLLSGGNQISTAFVSQWRSMDYSESLGFITTNVLGQSPELAGAWLLLRRWRTMRGIAMRGRYPTQPRGRFGAFT